MMLTFRQRLEAQRSRTDEVGTRDTWEDYGRYGRKGGQSNYPVSVDVLRRHIKDYETQERADCSIAITALDRVEAEWQTYMALHRRSSR